MHMFCATVGLPCVAQFSADGKWYRAKVIGVTSSGLVKVLYVDYGNSESLPLNSVCKLLQRFLPMPAQVSSIDNTDDNMWATIGRKNYQQEAQLPQRNSASAAHMEAAKPSSPLHIWLHLCVRSNPKPTTNVRQACRP